MAIEILDKATVASQIFNILLRDGTIANLIDHMPKMLDYTNCTTAVIHQSCVVHGDRFGPVVETYRPWNRWSSAQAKTYTGNYSYIGLNSRRLNRSVPSVVGSVAHEWGHCFEYFMREQSNGRMGFNHGSNSPVGKDNTFQYQLGRRVKKYVEEYEDVLLRRLAIIA
jgi:hypothetical protein